MAITVPVFYLAGLFIIFLRIVLVFFVEVLVLFTTILLVCFVKLVLTFVPHPHPIVSISFLKIIINNKYNLIYIFAKIYCFNE